VTIERQAAQALKWSAISRVSGQAVAWVVTLIVVRILAPEDYGLMAIVTVIISVMAGIAELGLGASIIQAKSVDKSDIANLAGGIWLLNLSLALVVVLGAPVAGSFFDDPRLVDVIRVAASHFILNAAATVPQSLAYREMRFKLLSGIELAQALVSSGCTLALAWSGAGVWALVLGSLTGAILRAVLLLLLSETVRPQFALRGVAQHLSFGGKVTTSRLVWQVVYQLDVLIAGRLLTKDAVGIYSVSMHFATLPMQKIMGLLSQVIFPTVARLQDEPIRLRERLLDGCRLLMFAGIPVMWGMSAVSPELVAIVLGDKWFDATFPLQVVAAVVPLRMLSNVLSSSVAAVGRPDVELRNTVVTAIVLPTAFLVGAHWGVKGLALSWTVAVPIMFFVNFVTMGRVLGITARAMGASVYGSAVAGGIMFTSVTAARLALDSATDVYRLGALVAVGAATYLVAATLLDRQIATNVRRLASAMRG
jgi:teichuronic acid exporter